VCVEIFFGKRKKFDFPEKLLYHQKSTRISRLKKISGKVKVFFGFFGF
jgi:hypothetical protein